MPHLNADALESDPKGLAFLRDVIGKPSNRSGSWHATVEPHGALRPVSRGCRLAAAAFRLLGFTLVIFAIAKSRVPSRTSIYRT